MGRVEQRQEDQKMGGEGRYERRKACKALVSKL
jgi:hypothetical protein